MVIHANGVLRGKLIELERSVSLPEGSLVSVDVRPRESSTPQAHRLLDELCGSWANDPSLGPIFESIAEQRKAAHSRPVSLDDPS